MPLEKEIKQEIIAKYRTHENDTGSTEVQIAILTKRIKDLTEHLKKHKKDVHTRYGLMKLVGRRRKLLRYLEQKNYKKYLSLKKELGIR